MPSGIALDLFFVLIRINNKSCLFSQPSVFTPAQTIAMRIQARTARRISFSSQSFLVHSRPFRQVPPFVRCSIPSSGHHSFVELFAVAPSKKNELVRKKKLSKNRKNSILHYFCPLNIKFASYLFSRCLAGDGSLPIARTICSCQGGPTSGGGQQLNQHHLFH